MKTCSMCNNYLGGGDFNLCCKVKYGLCYKDTDATDCKDFTNIELSAGWLSPTGEFFPVELYGHLDMARELLSGNCLSCNATKEEIGHIPDEVLVKRCGYIGIYLHTFFKREWAFQCNRRPTPEQLRFLKLYENSNIPISDMSQMWLQGEYE